MAKQVIRYLLEGDGRVPAFVQDGGYFMRGAEMIGISVDEDQRHVPISVHRMDEVELLEWIKECHKVNGEYVEDREGNQLNDDDMEALCAAFLEKL